MKTARIIFGIALITFAAGCGSSTTTPTTPSAPAAPITVTIQPAARTLATAAYVPNPATIPVGTNLTWSNTDTTTHDMVADSGAFDSGRIGPGGTFSMTFTTKGNIPYHCSIHAGMTGTIVVQ